jgi:hypothetical protein
MRHLLLHAAGSMAFQALRILQLHDIALLATHMSDADWDELTALRPPHARMWWAYPALELTSRYYKDAVPVHVIAALKDDCRIALRTLGAKKSLIDVSYSYLWVKAFPGIEWSRSIGELLCFAASRVRPDAMHLAKRNQLAATQTWAKDEWSGLSQSKRVLRWLASRPTRPVTMHAIASAFAQSK